MTKRAWHEVNWRKVGKILIIPTVLALIPILLVLVLQPQQVACIVEQYGEIVKAWGDDCDGAKTRLTIK